MTIIIDKMTNYLLPTSLHFCKPFLTKTWFFSEGEMWGYNKEAPGTETVEKVDFCSDSTVILHGLHAALCSDHWPYWVLDAILARCWVPILGYRFIYNLGSSGVQWNGWFIFNSTLSTKYHGSSILETRWILSSSSDIRMNLIPCISLLVVLLPFQTQTTSHNQQICDES